MSAVARERLDSGASARGALRGVTVAFASENGRENEGCIKHAYHQKEEGNYSRGPVIRLVFVAFVSQRERKT